MGSHPRFLLGLVMALSCSATLAISDINLRGPPETRTLVKEFGGKSLKVLDGGGHQQQPVLQAHAFKLSDVRLLPDADNHFAAAQALNTNFLKYLEPDRLLWTFRNISALPQVLYIMTL